MGLRYHILAGTMEKARHLATVMCMGPTEWRYVHSQDRIRGLRGGVLLVDETWNHNPDAVSIIQDAKLRQMHVLHVVDIPTVHSLPSAERIARRRG